jgi:hypothetical protein
MDRYYRYSCFIFFGFVSVVTNDMVLLTVNVELSTQSILVNCVNFDYFRHPMLRVYISKDDAQKKEYWSLCAAPTSSLASEVISTLEVLSQH